MGSWPEGVPHPPTPQKPEGITDWEWELYLDDDPTKHTVLRSKYPHLRDKVETAMGWKKDDVADAREIAEKVLGAVSIEDSRLFRPREYTDAERRDSRRAAGLPIGDGSDASPGKGHVPDALLSRYRSRKRLADMLDSCASTVSGMGEYDNANTLWAMAGKYRGMAEELRADLLEKPGEEE